MKITDKLLRLIEHYKLGNAVGFCLDNSTSQSLVYHGLSHCFHVMYHAHDAWQYTRSLEDETLKFGMEFDDCGNTPRELLLAALFHDFDYQSFERGKDHVNIAAARHGFDSYCKSDRIVTQDLDVYATQRLIKDTEYPHKPLDSCLPESYSLMLCCLLDADLFQGMIDGLMFAPIVGIKGEFQEFKSMEWNDYLKKTLDFQSNIQFRSAWGRNVANTQRNKMLERVEKFRQLCFGNE